jgi:hypothetical protein
MNKGSENDRDRWIHLLLDADLTPGQKMELEERLASERGHTDLEKAQLIRTYLQEIGRQTPSLENPDFAWHRIEEAIESEAGTRRTSSKVISRLRAWFQLDQLLPRLGWGMGLVAVAAGITLMVFVASLPQEPRSPKTGSSVSLENPDISGIKVYSSQATATTYQSTKGGGTVVWLSGIDDDDDHPGAVANTGTSSHFGEIWQVYSFKPEVTATTYESRAGNATIIWVSGMDYMDETGGQMTF